ncbi:hypothetical protein FQN54_003221 [Arachnomyces sp. PD_36]|nr:hypothetical protein FQN54_003221 [Arachnomyces sp. PD_36]
MYTSRENEPLTINVKTGRSNSKGAFATTTFQYSEEHSPSAIINGDDRTSGAEDAQSPVRRKSPMKLTSNGYSPVVEQHPPALYVRARYSYDADDHTSLSFRQGDIIQVLNQLETGWWDGVIDNVRGWFPSNYCAVVSGPDDPGDLGHHGFGGDLSPDSGAEDEYDDDQYGDVDSDGNPRDEQSMLPIEGTGGGSGTEQEEAAFWIPQATPDGRLFYFNTLTGYSTMELPLEAPTMSNETGPRDGTNFFVPEQTRPPPEMMARGFERDENEDDSEAEGESLMLASHASHDSLSRRRQSSLSEGVSPATSMDSLNTSPSAKNYGEMKNPQSSMNLVQQASATLPAIGTTMTSFTSQPTAQPASADIPRHFLDDGATANLTWSRLVDNMRHAIQAYRQTIQEGDRCEYVRRAEDISDHLRMLLAAGSDTTDNHSGNPSIISTNKALYPHFRDMMSKFSKLVLSSHIAAADWPGPDSTTKCLQEADGVMHGVYGYVEVARQQRGEDIRRLVPGFVLGSSSGGHWQSNNMNNNDDFNGTSFLDQTGSESRNQPSLELDSSLLDRVDELRKVLATSVRRLEEHLSLKEKLITATVHRNIGDAVCTAGTKVVELFRPWIGVVESINLAPLGTTFQNPQLVDFSLQKQRVYDAIADLVLGCQAVSAPLGDEWAELRGDSLEDRLNSLRSISRQFDNCVSQIGFSLVLLGEQIPSQSQPLTRTESRHTRGESQTRRMPPDSITLPAPFEQPEKMRRTMDKAQRFFGQAPPPEIATPREPKEPVREPEETPWFLKIDHEGEVFYDTKGDVPQLKCGTMAGLVEQLTRHDRLDASFNNTFLLTYRSFTTASELFEMLVYRFSLQPPYGLNPDELQMWADLKQKPIRFRVVNILKSWFEHFWMEPNDDANMKLLRRVHAFAKDSIAQTKTPGSTPLMAVVEQRIRGQDMTAKRLVPTLNTPAPQPIIPKNMKKLKFLDIDPTEFARQLTIIESRLYAKIRPTECLNKTWQKKVGPEDPEPAANVKALILHSNQLTNWVAEMILTQADVKRRVVVIKHFVAVADKCRALNNYSTLTSIISALATAPIHRLNRTWAQINARTSSVLEQMRRLMASTKNFGEYRETLHLANPPCIPFFGVYLTDLTFIEDGIPSLTPSDLINFNKRAKTAEVIRDIQQYQNAQYQLQPVPELQDYILSNMQAAGDVHEMYDRSLGVEPREREDEKIARYAYGRRYDDAFGAAMMVASM